MATVVSARIVPNAALNVRGGATDVRLPRSQEKYVRDRRVRNARKIKAAISVKIIVHTTLFEYTRKATRMATSQVFAIKLKPNVYAACSNGSLSLDWKHRRKSAPGRYAI